MAEQASITSALARFVADARWEHLPMDVRHEAKRTLVNYFACALAGCRDAAMESFSAALRPFSGKAAVTVIGRVEKTDALAAAYLNAASANVFDFDDTHEGTIIHPTAPVAAALFALAEAMPVSGADLLLALVIGIDVECRIGNAVSPGHYRRGWHITSTCGVFGAAAAAAKLLRLSQERVLWALGCASAQAGGLLETLGTMAKSVSVGNAARNGLAAALYAKQGIVGPDRPLEGPYGFFAVTGNEADPRCITDALGARWEIARNTYKPYPCGIVLSAVVEACLDMHAHEAIDPVEVQRVEITAHPLLRERTDRPRPQSGREAQVSAQHAVAIALARGRAGLAEFSDAAARDASLQPLRDKVVLTDRADVPVGAAIVTLHTGDGRAIVRRVDRARGSAGRPLSDRELEQKLEALVLFGGSHCDAAALAAAIWDLERADDASSVMALAAGHA